MQKRILSFVLSLSILLNMVGCQLEEEKDTTKNYTGYEDLLNKIDIEKYIEELNNIGIEYKYPEFYFTNEQIDEIYNKSLTLKECENTETENYENLYQMICDCNSEVENSPFSCDYYSDYEKLEISKKFLSALYRSLYDIYSKSDEYSEDYCSLKDVKIVIGDLNKKENKESAILGQYNHLEHKITIDYEETLTLYEKDYSDKIDFEEYLTYILKHELNHVRQFTCKCREEAGQENTSIQYTKEDHINDEYQFYFAFSSIIEASAESQIYSEQIANYYREYETEDFTYLKEREVQSKLMLLGMFKKNFSIEKYYQAINDSNLPLLYDIYNLETKEDLLNFYNYLYFLDSKIAKSPLSGYLIDNGYNTFGKLEEEIGSTGTKFLFKEVLKDLIIRIDEENITLEESMILYGYIKTYVINEEIRYIESETGESTTGFDDEFIDSIKQMENIFYRFICEYFRIEMNELEEFISNYEYERDLDAVLTYKNVMNEGFILPETHSLILSLLEKFPSITEIDFTDSAFTFYVDDFEESYEERLTRSLNN